MIWELIVTSAARGLKTGRSGFQSVLQTRGIHTALAESLEKASAYAHVYPVGDPRNPKIRSHFVRQGAWGTASVISRIVDAGNGYDGRSNKLAHHVAFDAREVQDRVKSSPAAVLQQLERSNAFHNVWQGDPREQPAGPFVPVVPAEPGPCGAWTRAAGDAGWAGFIADRALAKQPTWIIAPPGVDLVELFAEALALVNYPQRWGVTFTSYALDAGDALWLGTLDGSTQAQAARGQSRIAVVDLVRRPPLTTQSPLIAAARGAGAVPWKREAPAAAAAVAAPAAGPGTASASFSIAAAANGTRPPPVAGRPPVLARGGNLASSDPFGMPNDLPGVEGDATVETSRSRAWLVPTLVAGVLVLLAAGGFVHTPTRNWLVALVTSPRPVDVERDVEGKRKDGSQVASGDSTGLPQADSPSGPVVASGGSVASVTPTAPMAPVVPGAGAANPVETVQNAERLKALEQDIEAKVPGFETAVDKAVIAYKERRSPQAAVASAEALQREIEVMFNEARDLTGQEGVTAWADRRGRFDKAVADLNTVSGDLQKANTAFAGLKARLEQASHVPLKGIDAANINAQSGDLCFVDVAEINVQVPGEKWDLRTNAILTCTKDPKGSETWKVESKIEGQDYNPAVELGTVSVNGFRKLVIELPALPPGSSQDHFRARAALTCSVLRITSALEGGGTPPPEATTYVQIAKPIVEGAIVFKNFFEGDGMKYPPRQASEPSLKRYRFPDVDWQIRPVFSGSCGQLVGSMVNGREVEPKLAKGTAGMSIDKPRTWSMTWSWKDEPIVTTDFALGNRELEGALVKVVAGSLANNWSTRERLVKLDAKKPQGQEEFEFGGFPTHKMWDVQTSKVSPSVLQQVVNELVNELKDEQKDEDCKGFGDLLKGGQPQSLAEWRETLLHKDFRSQNTHDVQEYRKWVEKKCKRPQQPSGDVKPEQVKDFQQKPANYEQTVATDFPVSKYREDLYRKFDEANADPYEVLIFRCRKRLAEIEKGKDKVKELLVDGLGCKVPDNPKGTKPYELPDAVLTGEVAFKFGEDCHAVFMLFKESPKTLPANNTPKSSDVPPGIPESAEPATPGTP